MKDKTATKLSMNDILNKYQEKDPVTRQAQKEMESIKEIVINSEENDKIINYNKRVNQLDELYTSLQPLSDVIVRVFLIEPTITESGLIIPHKEIVPISTNNGVGTWAEAESPFPYSKKAVVIAVPKDHPNLSPGDIVMLSGNPIEAKTHGTSNNAYFRIKNEFFHPDSNFTQTPQDPNDRHYGYLLVSNYDIKVKI